MDPESPRGGLPLTVRLEPAAEARHEVGALLAVDAEHGLEQFLGHGGGAHAPNEWLIVESSNPKVAGFADQARLYADFLYDVAKEGQKDR